MFIIAWNMASEFFNPKNMTVGSNDLSGSCKGCFPLRSIFVNTFFIPIFSTISEISGSR